jgi:hypothetical protein
MANDRTNLRQLPYKDRPVETVPIELPELRDIPVRYREFFDPSTPTYNRGEASVIALLLREKACFLDQKLQVITEGENKKNSKPGQMVNSKKSTGPSAYTKRFLTNRIPVHVNRFVVADSDTAFLEWIRARVAVKREK